MFSLIQFLPLVVVIIVAVSVVRNVLQLSKKVRDNPPPSPRASEDPAQVDRTRRIQEEIRRKIAERRGQLMPPVVETAEPTGEPPVMILEAPAEPDDGQATVLVLERQRQLAEQMRALEEARLAEQRRAATALSFRQTAAESQAELLAGARDQLLADLGDADGLRRAIVLREVLGTPVGLR